MSEEFKFHLVSWTKVCTPIAEWGLRVHNLLVFNQALQGSGCGATFMRERPYGRLLWILNMAMLEVGVVLMRFMGRMGWGFERILARGLGGTIWPH
jgi:hypothetical protein